MEEHFVWMTTRRIKPGTLADFESAWRPDTHPEGMLRAYAYWSQDEQEIVGVSFWASKESCEAWRASARGAGIVLPGPRACRASSLAATPGVFGGRLPGWPGHPATRGQASWASSSSSSAAMLDDMARLSASSRKLALTPFRQNSRTCAGP